MSYATRQEFAAKVNWEGGLEEFFLGYGCSLEDLPVDDAELREKVAAVLEAARLYEGARTKLEDLLGDLLEE